MAKYSASVMSDGGKLTFNKKKRQLFLARLRTLMTKHGKHLVRLGHNPEELTQWVDDFLNERPITLNHLTQELLYAIGVFDEEPLKGHDFWSAQTIGINKYFDLDGKKICEIGAGVIPAWSIETAKAHPTSTITAYDPEIITDFCELPNLKTSMTRITSTTNLSEFDLGITIQPCQGSIAALRALSAADIDYFFTSCLCIHSPRAKTYDEQTEQYIALAKNQASVGRQIEVTYDEMETGNGIYRVPSIISYRKR